MGSALGNNDKNKIDYVSDKLALFKNKIVLCMMLVP